MSITPDEDALPSSDQKVIEQLVEKWRSYYLNFGIDLSAEELCADRTELVRLVRVHILFEREGLGELIPGGLSTKAELEVTARLPQAKQGGQGEMYYAKDSELKRVVVVKRIRPDAAQNSTLIRKFQRGVKINAQLDHPNIVPVLGSGRDATGAPFVVMRRISGQDLHEVIQKFHEAQPLPQYRSSTFYQLLSMFNAVCQAVDYAHSRHALHLDITTANIIVGTHGEVYLIDWGSSRRSFSKLVAKSPSLPDSPPIQTFDTPEGAEEPSINPPFMSPEQALKSVLTEATDIYQLGSVLYVIITGQLPFQQVALDSPEFAKLRLAVARGLKQPFDDQLRIPGPLVSIVNKAMHVEADKRFKTAQELANAIEKWMADEVVPCHSYSIFESLQQSARRRSTFWKASLAAIAVLFVAGCLGAFQLYRHNQVLTDANGLVEEKSQTLERVKNQLDLATEEKGEFKATADYLQNFLSEKARQWKSRNLNVSLRLESLKLEEAQVRAASPWLREPNVAQKKTIDEKIQNDIHALTALRVQMSRELQNLIKLSEASAVLDELLVELRQKLPEDAPLLAQVSAFVQVERAAILIERGLLSQARPELESASKHIAVGRDSMSERLKHIIDYDYHRVLGYYEAEADNPWLSLRDRQQAKSAAQVLFKLEENMESLMRLACACRLVAASELSVFNFDTKCQAYESLDRSRVEVQTALKLLDQISDEERDERWWENRYFTFILYANICDKLDNLADRDSARLNAAEALNLWQAKNPQSGWPRVQQLQARIDSLIPRGGQTSTATENEFDEKLRPLQAQLEEIRTQYPEFPRAKLDFMAWVKSLWLVHHLQNTEAPDRERRLVDMESRLDALVQDLMTQIKAGNQSTNFRVLLPAVSRSLANAAVLRGDLATAAKRIETTSAFLHEQLLEQISESSQDPSWDVVRGKSWELRGIHLATQQDFKAAHECMQRAVSEYEHANDVVPDKHEWIALWAAAIDIKNAVGLALNNFSDRGPYAKDYAQVLRLWKKCCELSGGQASVQYALKYDGTASTILTFLHSEERGLDKNPPGPYLETFRNSLQFALDRCVLRDKFAATWLASHSPWRPQKTNPLLFSHANILTQDSTLSQTLDDLESHAFMAAFDYYDYWEEFHEALIKRFQCKWENGNLEQPDADPEVVWLKRMAFTALCKPGPRWLRANQWQQTCRNHARLACISIPLPEYLDRSIFTDKHWFESSYGLMLQQALQREAFQKWLHLVDSEFRSASQLTKSETQAETWAEMVVMRHVIDECTRDGSQLTMLIEKLKELPAEQVSALHPSTLKCLVLLARVASDKAAADKFGLAVDAEVVDMIKASLAIRAQTNHDDHYGQRLVAGWVSDNPQWHSVLMEFESRLGEFTKAKESLQAWLSVAPNPEQHQGVSLRLEFDAVREQSNWKQVLGLDDPKWDNGDINVRLLRQFGVAWEDSSTENLQAFEELASDPHIQFMYWVHELLAELHYRAGNLAKARDLFQRALDDFPEEPHADDREYARIKAKYDATYR